MFHADSRRIGLGRRPSTAAIVILCAAATATAAASAATLHIRVPAHVPKGKAYSIELTGTFSKGDVSGQAYLISAIQYTSKPCASTAQVENKRDPQFYFETNKAPYRAGIFESKSPFTRIDGFTALRLGARRACSYLYSKQISPRDTTLPIARAGILFRVAKK